MSQFLIPAVLAACGYFAKSLFEIFLEYRKRNRELIVSKLQNFYWPICIRLKKSENVNTYLFQGKNSTDKGSDKYKIAHYVEKDILIANHKEILSIITNYRYLADEDDEIGPLLDRFIRHVSIYSAFIDSDIEGYPGLKADARYPSEIDNYFFEKTKAMQLKLDKMRFD